MLFGPMKDSIFLCMNHTKKFGFTHEIGDGMSFILDWLKRLMGPYDFLFLQVKLYVVINLKLLRNPKLLMSLLVLSLYFPKNIMNLLLDVANSFNTQKHTEINHGITQTPTL